MFHFLAERKLRKKRAAFLYGRAVAQSRNPVFYSDLGVPDTVDGRFDMIALHVFILMHRLKTQGEPKLCQALFDRMFKMMDPMLREMGVGDLSVPKHMKRMMNGFNGRMRAYSAALEAENNEAMIEALNRNIYASGDGQDNLLKVRWMADYVRQSAEMKTTDPVFADIEPEDDTNKGDQNAA
jgi:cytochrome b pre-mRNA-processing protein 3